MEQCGNEILNILGQTVANTQAWWKKNPEDFINEEGVLVCGVCKQDKQYKMSFPDPSEDDPDRRIESLVPCACKCDMQEYYKEKEEKRISDLRKASNMSDKYLEAAFDRYKITEHNQRNFKYAKHYAECFEKMMSKNQGLLFWGNVGTGKTFTTACIANFLIEKGYRVVFSSFVEILEEMSRYNDNYNYIDNLLSAHLLILDDLGTERDTRYAKEKVYYIVNSRIDSQKPMIFTTNLTLEEMQTEANTGDYKVYDRILGCCYPMQFTGPSWRMKSAYERFNEMEKLFNV